MKLLNHFWNKISSFILYPLNLFVLKKKIYVVEDNDDIRELVEYLLEIEGYEVKGFANATKFSQIIVNELPDLVVLDVMLPDGNGVDICNKLKSNPVTKELPVLLMSANANMAFVSKESMADDFISKPFDIDDLVTRAKKLLLA